MNDDYVGKEETFLKQRKNGLMLSDEDITILEENNIDYLKCRTIDELIYLITRELEGVDNISLEELNLRLSEMKYYHYTNK